MIARTTALLLLAAFPGWCAIARVNSAVGNGDADSTTIAAGALNTTTGNALFVFITQEYPAITITGIADTASNTYVSNAACKIDTDRGTAEIWWSLNVTGNASNVVTATFSGMGAYRRIAVVQYSGVGSFDVCALINADNSNNPTVSASFTPGAAGNTNLFCAAGNNTMTWSSSGSYTAFITSEGGNTGCGDFIGAGSGSQTGQLANGGSSSWKIGEVISLIPAGAAPAAMRRRTIRFQ